MKQWLNYFKHNRDHRRKIDWQLAPDISERMRVPLIRSLQRFQIGESGEGKNLKRKAAATRDLPYMVCIDLFVREEQEHARLMGDYLRKLHAPLLTHHWSDGCFILLRRLFGLHEELMVLLIPEIVAKRYFKMIHDGATDRLLQSICEQILQDEEGHVAFHIDYLRNTFERWGLPRRIVTRALWRFVFRLACIVVIADHRSVLRECGASAASFWWDCGLMFDEAAAEIFSYSLPRARFLTAHASR
jgi:hypothetical protein